MLLDTRNTNLRRTTGAACMMAIISIIASVFVASPALAASSTMVDHLEVPSTYSTLSLQFDEPITAEAAEQARASLGAESPGDDVSTMEWRKSLWCGDKHTFSDQNGSFTVAYYCGGTLMQRGLTRTVPWGYRLSAAVRSIVVGNVAEKGLTWWMNGSFGGQNAPHVEPPDYLFHGTIKPVSPASNIDCQDHLVFRHNIGPGGTGTVTFAARLRLVN